MAFAGLRLRRPHDPQAVCCEHGALAAVVLEGETAGVVADTVEFEHESMLGPVEVDLEAVEAGVDERLGQLGLADQPEHELLAAAAGVCGAGGCEDRLELLGAATTGCAGDDVSDLGFARQVAGQGLLDRPFEPAGGEAVGHVERGAGRGGDREPLMDADVSTLEDRGAVQRDARSRMGVAAKQQDLDVTLWGRLRCDQPPELPRREAAQDGVVADGEERGGLAGERLERIVAEGEDAGVDAVQAAAGEEPCDRRVADARGPELVAGHHAALAARDLPDPGVATARSGHKRAHAHDLDAVDACMPGNRL